jgi:hypothetical protein
MRRQLVPEVHQQQDPGGVGLTSQVKAGDVIDLAVKDYRV